MQKPAVVYGCTPGRMDVFWCDKDKSSVRQTWFDGSSWHTATIAQGDEPFGFAPAVYDNQPGKLDVGWTDRVGKIWYASYDGDHWATPVELQPSNMAGGQQVPGQSAGNWTPPANFATCSPLAGSPGPLYRRSPNTEFLVCDNQNNLWDLLSDNGTWTVSQMALDDRMAFIPTQVIAKIYTDSPQPHAIWCDKDGKLRVSYMSATPHTSIDPSGGFSWRMKTTTTWTTKCVNKYFEFRSSPQFSADDFGGIINVSYLVETIKVMPDPLSAYLWPQIRNQIPQDSSGWPAALASEFNRLCGGPSLYDKARFAQVALRKETRLLLAQNPQQGDDLRRLNRMLLEDGYSGHISRCLTYMGGVAYQPEVLAGLTPGRVDIFWASTNDWAIKQTVWDGSQWSTYTITWPRGYFPDSELVPVSGLRSGRTDLFCLHVRHDNSGKVDIDNIWWDGGSWQKATIAHGLSEENPPAAVYNPKDRRVHVFWVSPDNNLLTISTDGTAWTSPVAVGMISPVAISGFKPGRIDVFWGGADKQLKQAAGDGTTWNSVRLNPGRMAFPAAASTIWGFQGFNNRVGPNSLEFYWTNEAGALLYEWFDGHWHIRQLAPPGSVKSQPTILSSCVDTNEDRWWRRVNWINNDNKFGLASLYEGWGDDWHNLVLEYISDPGHYEGISNPPISNPPAKWTSRFGPVYGGFGIMVCDDELNLWSAVLVYPPSSNPVEAQRSVPGIYCRNLHLGPMAYAPTHMFLPNGPQPYDMGSYVFWCSEEDKSLRQSWADQQAWLAPIMTWHTVTVDPGPITSPPAIYQWESTTMPVHMFWRGRDGSLQHKWASPADMGETYRAAGWQTETIAPGPVCSDPYAVNNGGRIYVFWLDNSGKLQQTAQNTPAGTPGWSTINIAPATNDGSNFRDL